MARGRGSDRDSGRRLSGGGDSSRGGSRDDRDSSRPDKVTSGRKSADIKNGRSLKDVLDGSGGRGARTGVMPRPDDRGSDASRPRRSVQYQPVMSFKPPGSPIVPSEAPPEKSIKSPPGVASGGPPSGIIPVVRPVMRPPLESPRFDPEKNEKKSTEGPGETSRVAKSGDVVDAGWPRARAIGTGIDTRSPGEKSDRLNPPPRLKEARREGNRLWVTGTIKRHPDGFGFLIPDDASMPDIYISRQYMSGVMSNDRVEVEVFRARPSDRNASGEQRLFGEVKRVISRAHARIVGRFLPVDRRYGVIQDDGRGWGMDLRIPTEDSRGAHDGDWVAVEITDYASNERPLSGRVVKILGDVEDPLNDVIRVVHEKGIPDQFSFPAQREAAALGHEVRETDKAGREDLRNLNLVTIDGSTARDFDDAVYVESIDRGFRLIVAIADVSHYVKPTSPIDEDAYARGTSTYFPNFVVPMLPEELSNELCSLKPDVDRLCFACEMKLDFQGVIQEYRFFEGIMRSKARITYGEAQEVIDGSPNDRLRSIAGVCENVLRCGDLAKILMAKRMREGSLDLDIGETQVVVDSSGETIDIVKSERLFAHRLIEELMLVTNISTAKFFDDNRIHGIYRIHEEPDPENIKLVEKMMWNIIGPGMKAKGLGGGTLQKKLTKALQLAKGHPGAPVLNTLTLRAMNQAKYSSENVGHFGLGFQFYSHFTSPIRRYPDLIAHRLIKAVLYPRYRNQGMEIDEVASAATHLSACEQRSVKAERMVLSIKKARFVRRYLGETLDGSITSVAKFGVFVTLREFDIDGLVKLESLGPDRWVYDETTMRLYGRRTGRVFKLGDELRVVVQAADVSTGKVEFNLEDEERQVEEALVVIGDDVEVEEFAEAAEIISRVHQQRRNKGGGRHQPQPKGGPQAKQHGPKAHGPKPHGVKSAVHKDTAKSGPTKNVHSKSAHPKDVQAKNVQAKIKQGRNKNGRGGKKR